MGTQLYDIKFELQNELQLNHHIQPRHRYIDVVDRSDITVYDAETGHDIELDIC